MPWRSRRSMNTSAAHDRARDGPSRAGRRPCRHRRRSARRRCGCAREFPRRFNRAHRECVDASGSGVRDPESALRSPRAGRSRPRCRRRRTRDRLLLARLHVLDRDLAAGDLVAAERSRRTLRRAPTRTSSAFRACPAPDRPRRAGPPRAAPPPAQRSSIEASSKRVTSTSRTAGLHRRREHVAFPHHDEDPLEPERKPARRNLLAENMPIRAVVTAAAAQAAERGPEPRLP